MRDWDGIFFLLDGREFAFRAWDQIPRAGDLVVLGNDQPYEVKQVLWRETKGNRVAPYVEVIIEHRPALAPTADEEK